MKKSRKGMAKTCATGLVIAFTVVAFTIQAAASGGDNYAKNLGIWILENVAWVILVAGIATAGVAAIKRNVTVAIVTLIITALLFVICYNAETVFNALGNMLKGLIGL